jgi:hypothetical protein
MRPSKLRSITICLNITQVWLPQVPTIPGNPFGLPGLVVTRVYTVYPFQVPWSIARRVLSRPPIPSSEALRPSSSQFNY